MNPTTLAAAIEAELNADTPAELVYTRHYLTYPSRALAGAGARRIGEAIGEKPKHDEAHHWWEIGKHVHVFYNEVTP